MACANQHLHITLVYAPRPRQVLEQTLLVPAGSTVKQALQLCDWQASLPEVCGLLAAAAPSSGDAPLLACGIWGKKCALEQILQDGDRLELYRLLRVDPKTARRRRFDKQGSRTAGLFARSRVRGRQK